MEPEKQVKHTTVETYAADMARVLEDDKGGLIKKIIEEQEAAEQQKKNSSPESKKNKFYMYSGLIFLLAAIGVLGYFLLHTKATTVPVVEPVAPLIFNDKSSFLEVAGLNRDQVLASIVNEVQTSLVKPGGVEEIYLTENKNIIGLRRTLAILKSTFDPQEAINVNDNFMIGIVNNNSKDLFILLKTRSHIDIFPVLRTWEQKMLGELSPLFEISLALDNKYLENAKFEDGVIDNKNARIVYNKDHSIALMYVFLDDNSVVITDSPDASHEVLLRLLSSQIKK